MISLPAAVRVYLCTTPCDMRRGFDGLRMLAEQVIGVDPLGGHLFVFCGRRADRVKILCWDRDGWALWAKRLEAGTYAFPFDSTGRHEITSGELGALLEGIPAWRKTAEAKSPRTTDRVTNTSRNLD